MYALIFDTHELDKPKKRIISTHKDREAAEAALETRKKELGKKIWECDTRVVWIERSVEKGDAVLARECSNWKPGEEVPYGETHSDTD